MTNALGTPVETFSLFGYDANGNQVQFTNAALAVTTNVFDCLNRVIEMDYADGTKSMSGFDEVGRRIAQTNQDGIVTRFGYDGAGRLVSVTNAFGQPEQMVTCYQYDQAGNEIGQIDGLNRTNRYAYDLMGRRVAHWMPDASLGRAFCLRCGREYGVSHQFQRSGDHQRIRCDEPVGGANCQQLCGAV